MSYSRAQPGIGGQRETKKIAAGGEKGEAAIRLASVAVAWSRNGNSERAKRKKSERGRRPSEGPRVRVSSTQRLIFDSTTHFFEGVGAGFGLVGCSCSLFLRALEADGPPSPRNLSWKLVLEQCRVRIGLVGNENENDNDGDFFQ